MSKPKYRTAYYKLLQFIKNTKDFLSSCKHTLLALIKVLLKKELYPSRYIIYPQKSLIYLQASGVINSFHLTKLSSFQEDLERFNYLHTYHEIRRELARKERTLYDDQNERKT